jgi:hypothetical protein
MQHINSVKYHQKIIKTNFKYLSPIWIVKDKYNKYNKYKILDGVHRIVAAHIKGK